jgi:carbohydrate diacid regulator
MLLSAGVAEAIVAQLSQVMEQHINIMDKSGIIVASTDPNRVGAIHGGAVRILEDKLPELIIETNQEYVGAKNGINLPIEFNNEIIGVIGLTGKSEEVYKYGRIIKKMTEVLLRDAYNREQQVIEQKAKDRFLEEWVLGKYDINYPLEFKRMADTFGIDVVTKKRVMVISVPKQINKNISDQELTEVSRSIRGYLKGLDQAHMFRTSTSFVCIFNFEDNKRMQVISEKIYQLLSNRFRVQAFIGLDTGEEKDIRTAYDNANLALKLSMKTSRPITIYDALNVDIFIDLIPLRFKLAYLERFFNIKSLEEIEEWIELLRVFLASEGSLTHASEQLFIHKNTLQYRLNKLSEITGYDPRKLSMAYLFTIAVKLYDSIKDRTQ